jgi:hypothetical protein
MCMMSLLSTWILAPGTSSGASAVHCPLSAVRCLLSTVCCLLSAVCCLLCAVCCLLYHVQPIFTIRLLFKRALLSRHASQPQVSVCPSVCLPVCLSHHNATKLNSYTVILSYYYTSTLLRSYTVTLIHCDTVTLARYRSSSACLTNWLPPGMCFSLTP